MSFNRENIIWQSCADQRWYRGFYRVEWVDDSEDADPEWDVEYADDFEWVSGPHANVEAARASWTGANPGIHYEVSNGADTTDLDRLYNQAVDNGYHVNRRRSW